MNTTTLAAETANKSLVRQFFAILSTGDQDAAFELVDDQVQWWVPGALPFSGTKTKAQYRTVARTIQASFPAGFTLAVLSLIEEGDTVAAEVESHGQHVNGRTYNNKYHFLLKIRGARIVQVKEYMDTQHLAALIAP
jgi:ketosteroid isomerase-like protein